MCKVPGSLWYPTTDNYTRSQYAYERYFTLHKVFAHTKLIYKCRKEAIQKTIMAMTLGKDVSALFPDVLKNVATSDLDQKKLVYLYLMYGTVGKNIS